LCPQYLENPKIVLRETIAHELAHSFDPCNLSKGITKKLGPEYVEETPFNIQLKMDNIVGNYSAYPFDETIPSKNIFQLPMKFSNNPFQNTIQCLQNPESINAKILDQTELKKKLATTIKEIKENELDDKTGGPFKYYQFLENNLDSYLDFNAGCNLQKMGIDMGLSQIQEAFADKILALLEQPALWKYCAEGAIATARQFDFTQYTQKLYGLYLKALGEMKTNSPP
jgi:hypothetical protein